VAVEMKSLQQINLGSNTITDEGAASLARAMSVDIKKYQEMGEQFFF
jgi:hypothetical protein